MIELFPQGFEEVDKTQGTELAAYTGLRGVYVRADIDRFRQLLYAS